MKSRDFNVKYVEVTMDNIDIAYNIQKAIWKTDPDYNNFFKKANNTKDDNIAFIVYFQGVPIGITGVYIEDIDLKSIWLDWFCVLPEYRRIGLGKTILTDTIQYAKELKRFEYFRVETTYWEGRPAIKLYDEIMTFKEKYTIEDTSEIQHNWIIYTYTFGDKREYWNNRNLELEDYYKNCKSDKKG